MPHYDPGMKRLKEKANPGKVKKLKDRPQLYGWNNIGEVGNGKQDAKFKLLQPCSGVTITQKLSATCSKSIHHSS